MPYARLVIAQFAIGAAAIFARYALTGAGAFAVSALRLVVAALLALAFARRLRPLGRRRELAACGGGVLLAAHFATWIGSLDYTSVAISTLLVTTTPIWTEAYDALRRKRAPARTIVGAFALASSGIVAIALDRTSMHPPVAGHALVGDGLALIGSLAIGAYLLLVRELGALPGGGRIATRQIVARTYGWAALALVAAAAIAHQPPPGAGDLTAWAGIVAMALVSQSLGHTILNAALRDFTPTTIAMTTLLEPAIAAGLAAVLFHERVGATTACGAVAVVGAIVIALRADTFAERADRARD